MNPYTEITRLPPPLGVDVLLYDEINDRKYIGTYKEIPLTNYLKIKGFTHSNSKARIFGITHWAYMSETKEK